MVRNTFMRSIKPELPSRDVHDCPATFRVVGRPEAIPLLPHRPSPAPKNKAGRNLLQQYT
jgi:hypothetical protein